VLLLDTGDALVGGGILGDKTQGEVIVEGMNLMGYDAMALGPKELSLGPDLLLLRMNAAEFPIVSANVVQSDTGEPIAQPFVVVERAGHHLAVIGLTRTPDEVPSGFEVLDPQQVVQTVVKEAAKQADTIIVLTNLPYRSGIALAEAVPGIDLLVAAEPGQLPTAVATVPGTGTLVVTAEQPLARHTGRRVGRLMLTVLGDGSLQAESWESKPMDRTIVDDLEMAALLNRYR
jgi:5'-nucleotidase/UDP-sugar diphosphatase